MNQSKLKRGHLQIWGGIECTVNRVGDAYRDQLVDNGHAHRDSDLDLIAELSLPALRYPVLWERVMPGAPEEAEWSWTDRRLIGLRERGIAPIAGLVHHGSGPRHTHLMDYGFVTGLRDYAMAVARRYPWIDAYTPVNEPLTTARFSGLYGHWYPHARCDEAFATALVLQCLATAEAMRAVRQVNPEARLVLTEDLAKVHSTPLLKEQAAFENERRWLSIDLLMGRVDRQHVLWRYLARNQRLVEWLSQLTDNPLPPDLLGFNYYLTSERMLDERWENYPAWSHGGNGRYRYADIEAVRVLRDGIDGRQRLLAEAWQRYGLPMAVTEVHLCGSCDDQMRWLVECWEGARQLRSAGIDLRAITVWSMFGSFDWNSLCTCNHGVYEPGVFDIGSGQPCVTPLTELVKRLASGLPYDDLLPPGLGWWHGDERLAYAPVCRHVLSPSGLDLSAAIAACSLDT